MSTTNEKAKWEKNVDEAVKYSTENDKVKKNFKKQPNGPYLYIVAFP